MERGKDAIREDLRPTVMDLAGWTIGIIAILIVAAIALNISRKNRRRR
jgi:hypothetical protein